MKNLKTRKVVLLSAAAVLLICYILMIVFGGKDKTKVLSVKKDIDEISIENSGDGSNLHLLIEDGNWVVEDGDLKKPVKKNISDKMVSCLQNVTLIGKSSDSSAGQEDRFGLDEGSVVIVKAFVKGKLVRTLFLGKNTSTGSQTYVCADEKQTVYLSYGAIRNNFMYTVDKIEDTEVQNDSAAETDSEVNADNSLIVQ